jgi:hypothetical protein
MLSRDLVLIHRQWPTWLRSASRYGLGSEETVPLPIVDVDKSVEIDAPMSPSVKRTTNKTLQCETQHRDLTLVLRRPVEPEPK